MNKEEILQFLNENPAFALATCDGNIPHVRTLLLHKADETGIYIMVGLVLRGDSTVVAEGMSRNPF